MTCLLVNGGTESLLRKKTTYLQPANFSTDIRDFGMFFENRVQMFSEILKKKLGIIFSVLHCVSMRYELFSFVPAPKFELFSENVYFMSVTN